MKKLILTTALLLGISGTAFANSCPAVMAKIDEAMKTATLDEATKAKVMELYAKGKAEHEAGNHDASGKSLSEASQLMGI